MASSRPDDDTPEPAAPEADEGTDTEGRPEAPPLVQVDDLRPEGYTGSCLRPLGLCDLGACDVCFYGPNGPIHRKSQK